jgi:hypothetical protein
LQLPHRDWVEVLNERPEWRHAEISSILMVRKISVTGTIERGT